MELDDLVAEVRSVGDVDFKIGLLLLHILGSEFLVCTETRLLLGLPCLRCHPHPLKLTLESLPAFALLLLFHRKTPCLLIKP